MQPETQEQQFEDTPRGWAQRWSVELSAARKEAEKWQEQGAKIVKRFLDERDHRTSGETRWTLFTSTVETKMSSLYGQTPKACVSRRFADAKDDVARVAAEMLERMLNADIEKDGDGYEEALRYVLEDRLLPGGGCARIRYVVEMEDVPETPAIVGVDGKVVAPAVPATTRKAYECVETDYVHWRDALWSPCRVWPEARWVAYRAQMSMEQMLKRFGDVAKGVPLNARKREDGDEKQPTPWDRAEVWEIWDKETRKVYWYVEGFGQTLDIKEDPLGLDGFFPGPKPFIANPTTTKFLPRADFVLTQDLYDDIDRVSTRITLLQEAIRVAGVYDKSSDGVRRLVSDARQNELIPVDNWALFAEKGGVRGQVDWLPLEPIVAALSALREYRAEMVDALHQMEGMADIMRGQATTAGATATEQSIKARFGSIRLQRIQDEFARFATDLLKLKAEVIAKHFDPQTILAQANAAGTFDEQLAPQAVELIKSKLSAYRIEVKPEAISLTDFAALKSERMEVLAGLASFLQAAGPLATSVPGSMPFMLQMLQWAVAGLKGSSGIEGVLDQAITAAQQAPPAGGQQQPDPKLLTQQMKGQQDLAKVQAELQADLVRTQAEVQADAQREQNQAIWNVREAAQKHQIAAAGRALNPGPQQGSGGVP